MSDLIEQLEMEALHVLRVCAAEMSGLALLFSGGKDSTVILHLLNRAVPHLVASTDLLHIDTGFNFPEIVQFVKDQSQRYGCQLKIATVEEFIAENEEKTPNQLQSKALKQLIKNNSYQAVIGGGRRDEDKARSKEIFFSKRDLAGSWDPTQVTPEIWPHFLNTLRPGEHYRVFPINNWTERDIWAYIAKYEIPVCELYFARNGRRYRTIGDQHTSVSVDSVASNVIEVLAEIIGATTTERAGRQDDQFSEFSMELRKKEGYF